MKLILALLSFSILLNFQARALGQEGTWMDYVSSFLITPESKKDLCKKMEQALVLGKNIQEEIVEECQFSSLNKEKILYLESIAKLSKKDQIFYTWQLKSFGEKISGNSYYSRLALNSLMFTGWPKVSETRKAGRGLYVSEHMYESDIFMPNEEQGEGMLYEVIMPKGEKTLNIVKAEVNGLLRNREMTKRDLFEFNIPLAIKYVSGDMNWWVLKNVNNIIVRPFTGEGLSTEQLLKDALKTRANPRSKALVKKLLKEILPKRIVADHLVKDKNKDKFLFLWRHDGTCGQYQKEGSSQFKLVFNNIDKENCKRDQGIEYHWADDSDLGSAEKLIICQLTPIGHPFIHIDYAPESKCGDLPNTSSALISKNYLAILDLI